MIEVYLYGEIKKIVENTVHNANSIMLCEYVEGENFQEFLNRLGLRTVDVGNCFINNSPAELDYILHNNDTIELNPKKN